MYQKTNWEYCGEPCGPILSIMNVFGCAFNKFYANPIWHTMKFVPRNEITNTIGFMSVQWILPQSHIHTTDKNVKYEKPVWSVQQENLSQKLSTGMVSTISRFDKSISDMLLCTVYMYTYCIWYTWELFSLWNQVNFCFFEINSRIFPHFFSLFLLSLNSRLKTWRLSTHFCVTEMLIIFLLLNLPTNQTAFLIHIFLDSQQV